MASEWLSVQLGEVAKFKAGSAFKPEHQGQRSGDLPFIKVSDLNLVGNEHAIRTANNWISRDLASQIKAAVHPAGSTVFAKIGVALTYNRRRLLLQDTAIDNNMMSAAPNEDVVNPRYLYFLLKSLDFNEIAQGSALPYLNVSDLKAITVELPDLGWQREALTVLAAIEDRIDCLLDTSATLEAIAQALFKSWFVDFDPVRAKAEGREPEGMDAATVALFPSDFDDTRGGSLPSGWQPTRYGDVALLSKGTVKPQEAPSTEFQHYSLPAFDAHKLPVVELGEAIKSGKTPVPSGAVLVSKLNPHIPRIWFVGDVAENSVCSTEFLVWTPRANAGSAFLFCLAASQVFNSAMRQLVTGTSNSHQRVKPDQLANVEVIAASDEVISAFETIAAPLLAKVHHNRQRAATLGSLRDTLLPRLISGRLRLPEAEREVEAATA